MEDNTLKVLKPYALAAMGVATALLLTLIIPPLHQQFKFLLFALAVVVSATGGIWPGVFATLLSAVLAVYYLVPPLQSSTISGSGDLLRLILFCGVGFVITWITDRFQRTEETLRAAAALVDSSPESIMRLGLDNSILSWNKAGERIYGYTAEEAIGRSVALIVAPERRDELQRLVERVHRGESVQSYETVRIRQDGTKIDVALTLSPVQDRKRRIVGASSISRDITERKHAEEAIRQSHAKLERQTEQLKLLAEMNDLLQASSIPADAYAVIARFAQKLIPACSGALYVYSSSRGNLEVVLRWGDPQAHEPDFVKADECWGLRTGSVHRGDGSPSRLLCRHLPEPPPDRYICAPMIALGETVGLLHLRLNGPDRAAAESVLPDALVLDWPVRTMAERLALTLSDLKLREALRAQSICDPLTGWYNRRHMLDTLDRDVRRATRTGRPLSVLMLDIDNFKEFNDSFGHEAGDVALQTLCQMLKAQIRGEDVACRYGGDEFVLILPDSPAELAAQRADEMRNAVGLAAVQYQGHLLKPMTLSFGTATFPSDGKTAHELLRAADSALLRTKSEGRDCVRSRGKAPEPITRK